MTNPQSASRRRVPVAVAIVVVLALIAAVVWWFVRPLDTTIKASSAVTAAVVGDKLALDGEVQPAEAGREVIVQQKQAQAWTSAGKGETDSAGAFSITVPMPEAAEAGKASFRVVVAKLGRRVAATSATVAIKALKRSTLTLSGPKSVAKGQKATFTGSVVPAVAGRTVTVEQSGDGKNWVAVGGAAKTVADGSYTVSVLANGAGPVQFRTTAAVTGDFGMAVAKPAMVLVEDFKAAGALYLAAVEPSNAAGQALQKVAARQDSSLAEILVPARAYSLALKKFADHLTGYKAWPASVQPSVDALAAVVRHDYDLMNQIRTVKTLPDFFELYNQVGVGGGDAAVAIRQLLNLPARPIT